MEHKERLTCKITKQLIQMVMTQRIARKHVSCEETQNPQTNSEIDPMQFCQHIPSEVKKAKQRLTLKNIQLSEKELEEERAIQRHQLEEMFNLMKAQGDKFGLADINEMKQQMNLYSIN
eukprot:XP_014779564.1 PREDICTED: uncharacterized protein LOC106875805 isoform X2 [Octopus bimaculoides]